MFFKRFNQITPASLHFYARVLHPLPNPTFSTNGTLRSASPDLAFHLKTANRYRITLLERKPAALLISITRPPTNDQLYICSLRDLPILVFQPTFTSLIKACVLPSVSSKNTIHVSVCPIFATRCGSSVKTISFALKSLKAS